jgi:hypothetical protein
VCELDLVGPEDPEPFVDSGGEEGGSSEIGDLDDFVGRLDGGAEKNGDKEMTGLGNGDSEV